MKPTLKFLKPNTPAKTENKNNKNWQFVRRAIKSNKEKGIKWKFQEGSQDIVKENCMAK